MSGEATLTLKVIPDWSLYDAGLREREARGINIKVGIGGGGGAGGGTTSTDPGARTAQAYQQVERDMALAVSNRNAFALYAQPKAYEGASNLGPFGGRDSGLKRYAVWGGAGRASQRALPPGFDFESTATSRGGTVRGQTLIQNNYYGGAGGGRGGGGGGGGGWGTFGGWDADRGRTRPFAYDPETQGFFDIETGEDVEGRWPGGGGRRGGGGSRGGRRRNSLYDIIGRYAPAGIAIATVANMITSYQQAQMAQISAAGNPIASAQAALATQRAVNPFANVPFIGGAIGDIVYGNRERAFATVAGLSQGAESRSQASISRFVAGTIATGAIAVAQQRGSYARSVAEANADYANRNAGIEQSAQGAIAAENTAALQSAQLKVQGLSGTARQNVIDAEKATNQRNLGEIDRVEQDQFKASTEQRKFDLDKADRDRSAVLYGFRGSRISALQRANLDPLGAQMTEFGTAAEVASLQDPMQRDAAYRLADAQEKAAGILYTRQVIESRIIAGGQISAIGETLANNPIGAIQAAADAQKRVIEMERPTGLSATKAAMGDYYTRLEANDAQARLQIQQQQVSQRLTLQQYQGRVAVTGFEAQGKPYTAEATDIFNRTQQTLTQLSAPGTANAAKLKEAAIAAGRNEELGLARRLTIQGYATPAGAADILNPYSIGNRGFLPGSLTETNASGINAALGLAGQLAPHKRGKFVGVNANAARTGIFDLGATIAPAFPILGGAIEAGAALAPQDWMARIAGAITKVGNALNALGGAGAAAGTSSN